jgi:hypothetical protein
LGGSNSSLYTGNFVYTPVIEKSAWMFYMNGYKFIELYSFYNFEVLFKFLSVTIGNAKVCTSNPYDKFKGCYAFADSGHTLLSGPQADINTINKQLRTFISLSGFINCNLIPQMPSKKISIL